ncbi:hypothetical protein GW17_00038808 [Ensete ventricosum]|nr:hypothetical protein GW17_00038808 [Ensete ventricosum]
MAVHGAEAMEFIAAVAITEQRQYGSLLVTHSDFYRRKARNRESLSETLFDPRGLGSLNDSVYEHSRFEPIKDGGRPASSCGKPKQWEKAAPKAGADQVSNSHDRDELRRVCAVEGHPLQPRPPRQSILRGKAESGV